MVDDIGTKTKSGLYWSVGLKIPYEVFRFATSIIVARILEPKDFGIISIATMVIYYSNSFTNFGFNQALVQRKDITQKHINSVFSFDLVVSVVIGSIIFLSSGYVAGFFNSPESKAVIQILSVIFILTTFHDLPYVLLRRDIDFKIISIVDIVREITMSLLTLCLAYFGFKYWSIVWGHIIPLFLAAVYLMVKTKYPLRVSYHHSSLKELFNFSIWSFIQMQIYFLSSRLDRIIIGKYLDITMLGFYEKSKSLSQMPSESIGPRINRVFFSSFSRAQVDKDEITRYFNKGLVIMSAINFPIYFGLYAVAPHFVLVLLGEKWQMIVHPFQIMAIAGPFVSLNGFISALAVGTGHLKSYTIVFAVSTVVLFVGSLFVVQNGITAVAWILVLYSIVLFYLSYRLVKKYFEMKWSDLIMGIYPAFVSGLFMFVGVELSKIYIISEINMINLILLVCLGAGLYTSSMMFIPSQRLNDIRGPIKYDLYKIWVRFSGKRN